MKSMQPKRRFLSCFFLLVLLLLVFKVYYRSSPAGGGSAPLSWFDNPRKQEVKEC